MSNFVVSRIRYSSDVRLRRN